MKTLVPTLKVVSSFEKPAAELDPARITTFDDYRLSMNLYSPLIMHDVNGEAIPGVAESFRSEGDELFFEFGNRVATASGHALTAIDAGRSLKRTLLLKENLHSSLRDYLCDGPAIESIDDNYPGIQVRGKTLVLKLKSAHRLPYIIEALENADFSVIPSHALSLDSRNPRIIDHRETSGPYYVEQDNENGAWILRANPNHFLFSPQMVQRISMIPYSSIRSTLPEALESGEIDFIPTGQTLFGASLKRLLARPEDFHFHNSAPIRVSMIAFNPSAMTKFTREQRLFIGASFKRYIDPFTKVPGGQDEFQFYPAGSDYSLSESELEEIKQMRNQASRPSFETPVRLSVVDGYYERFKTFFADTPEFEISRFTKSSHERPIAERGDAYTYVIDSNIDESFSLLAYNFKSHNFHLPGVDADEFLKTYIKTAEKPDRTKMIKDLHYKMLKEVSMYPANSSPYTAISRHPWLIPMSTFDPSTRLWQIRHA